MICYLYDTPSYWFFAPDVPELLYYSHIPATILTLLVGLFVFLNRPKQLTNQLLLIITLSFSAWTLLSLTGWTNINADLLAFLWPFYGVSAAFISIFSIYFVYAFIDKHDVSFRTKVVFFLLLLPVLLFGHTDLSLSGFNLINCDAFDHEGLLYKTYFTALGFLAMIWIAVISFKRYRTADTEIKKQIRLMFFGVEFFLFSFITTTFIVTYLVNLGFLPDSRLEMFGLFGMMFFMVMIGLLIVRFKAFNVGMLASQALVIALAVLVAAQFTYASTPTTLMLKIVTLIFTSIAGLILVRSVKKEVEQREELEKLTTKLAAANGRLKELDKLKSEFVSIASHQLRSPITAIRGYVSLLLEGDFGKMPKEAIEPLERVNESSKRMALSIEDYLNVSRIESGNMQYNYSDFSLRNEVEKLCDDMRPEAIKKGLTLLFRTSDLQGKGDVHADIGKTIQIVQNLINNAIKYTPKGSISVYVRDDVGKKKVYVDIVDTGVGIAVDELETVFEKFERARNANAVNAHGTGLGLFVAIKTAKAMDGDITVHSDGTDKGSRFTFELPLAI